ncbi:unnamed protein product [Rotaria sordida]|uniref:Band 7 domain-containing protein n=1 Tax=Rotaria sordida TaxID=392033 RepID=A0A815RXC6_9BILA|nr:unnamed protein product [Rotaria sordida]
MNTSSFETRAMRPTTSREDYHVGLCGYILVILSYVLIFITFPFSLTVCLKVVQEYERAVMFRLGRILGGAKGPGLFIIVPCVDAYTKVDLRTVTFDVPPQEILTKDSVTVAVDAVVYFRVFDPVISITNVEDAPKSTQLLAATSLRNVLGTKSLQEILSDRESIAQTMQILTKDSVTVAVDAVVYFRVFDPVISITNVEDAPKSTQLLAATSLRNVLGTKSLQEILSDRESIAQTMQAALDEGTECWGVRVERVEVKDVRLPVQLQRAMAAEAEAAREARAKVIAAEGEQKAARALKDAADVIMQSPTALQLRYLQTLTTIASEKNSTIVFPIPIELMQAAIGSFRTS